MTAFPEIAWREKTGSKQDGLPVRHRQKNSTLLCNYLPLQKWFDALRHGLSKHFCFLTFDLEIRQRVEQRALGHQLLVDGVLETHGAGVGTRHCQIGLHGWINKQRVCWKKKKKNTGQNKTKQANYCQQLDVFEQRLHFRRATLQTRLPPSTTGKTKEHVTTISFYPPVSIAIISSPWKHE